MIPYFHVLNLIPPNADAFEGTAVTPPVNLDNWEHISFIVLKGAGDTGTETITVEACADTTGASAVAIPFKYAIALSGDAWSDYSDAAEIGFTTTPGGNQSYRIELDARALSLSGYCYAQLNVVKVADGPVAAAVMAILTEGRFEGASEDSALI